jgi:hypothetical protein
MAKNSIHFAVDPEIKKMVIDYCVKHDITMSQFMRWASLTYMEKYNTPIPIKEMENETKSKLKRKAA